MMAFSFFSTVFCNINYNATIKVKDQSTQYDLWGGRLFRNISSV